MEKTKKMGFSAILGVMSVFFCSQAGLIVNPALAAIAEQYPDISYSTITLLSTIVSLLSVPSSILGGAIAGKKIKYKTLAIISMLCIIIGGIAPYFISNFYLILATRAIIGIGAGFIMPLGNPLVMCLFNKKRAETLQGIGTTVMNFGGVTFQIVAGLVCAIGMEYVWFVHFIILIPLIFLLIFMPEPESEQVSVNKGQEKSKLKMPLSVYLISISFGVAYMCFYPFLLNLSIIVSNEGLGTSAIVGTISSLFTIGGVVAGIIYGKVIKVLGKFNLTIMYAIIVLGMVMGYFGHNVVTLMISSFVLGVAFFIIWPASIREFGNYISSDGLTLASGIFTAFLNLGAFFASPYAGIITSITKSDNPRHPIIIGAIIIAIITIIWFVVEIVKRQHLYNMSKNKM